MLSRYPPFKRARLDIECSTLADWLLKDIRRGGGGLVKLPGATAEESVLLPPPEKVG